MTGRGVYLDYNATTPCDPRVVEAMQPYFTELAANPSSSHNPARRVHDAIQSARCHVGAFIEANAEDIVFTSGATESINLALRGFVTRHSATTSRRRIVTTPLEHSAVLETCKRLEQEDFEIVSLPVDNSGTVSIEEAKALIDDNTLLVSIQASNNEIGTIQPIPILAEISHRRGAAFHCDAAQSVGKIPVSVAQWNVDFMSFSAHKMYGPKGTGALFVRGGARSAVLAPILDGGGQENGLRSGTLNAPAIIGFGRACQISALELPTEIRRIEELRTRLETELLSISTAFRVNASKGERLPNTSSMVFSGFEADALLLNLPHLALSLGSACSSGAIGPSHVLRAIGLLDADAYSTVRFSLGRFTTRADIDFAIAEIASALKRTCEQTT